MLLILAGSEAVIIFKLLRQQSATIEEPAIGSSTEDEANEAIVEMLCASISDQKQDWSLKNGVMVHKDGLEISLMPDGHSVCFKRGDEAYGLVVGKDAERIKAAVLSRNLRKAFLGS
jgi:hypothetical protein